MHWSLPHCRVWGCSHGAFKVGPVLADLWIAKDKPLATKNILDGIQNKALCIKLSNYFCKTAGLAYLLFFTHPVPKTFESAKRYKTREEDNNVEVTKERTVRRDWEGTAREVEESKKGCFRRQKSVSSSWSWSFKISVRSCHFLLRTTHRLPLTFRIKCQWVSKSRDLGPWGTWAISRSYHRTRQEENPA